MPVLTQGAGNEAPAKEAQSRWSWAAGAVYIAALAVCVSTWLLAIRSPLWLDETLSYWSIHAGFWQIPFRQGGDSFPAYSYVLWLATKLMGTSEIALRIPSAMAMLGAAWLLYLAAREMFEREIAAIAAAIFCLDPIVIFAANDARPYAFATLAEMLAVLAALRLRKSDSAWAAALPGLAAAVAVWFHYFFAVIAPALLVCAFWGNRRQGKVRRRQFGIALAAFAAGLLPAIPGLMEVYRTRATHVYETAAPTFGDLFSTIAPSWLPLVFGVTAMAVGIKMRHQARQSAGFAGWQVAVCCCLGVVPLLLLYAVSAGTSMHIFAPRYRLMAIPGIALFWALALSPFRWRPARMGFCMLLVGLTAGYYFAAPGFRHHQYTWKYALQAAAQEASAVQVPVLISSAVVESNFAPMPWGKTLESRFLAPLSYYPIGAPVVGMPQALNADAERVGGGFVDQAASRRQRFLAMGFSTSYPTLDWLARRAAGAYSVRVLGVYDGVAVLDFEPRNAGGAAGRTKTDRK